MTCTCAISDRLSMARQIVDWEARRDSNGHLRVYLLPANDGGGAFEVAGINEKYDHDAAVHLRGLIEEEKFEEAEEFAVNYIADNTEPVANWSVVPAIEFFLRDTAFNRGVGGAGKILQMALGFKGSEVDGIVGPKTRSALSIEQKRPQLLLYKLRVAREEYERTKVGVRDNFITGLTNRWDNAFETAIKIA